MRPMFMAYLDYYNPYKKLKGCQTNMHWPHLSDDDNACCSIVLTSLLVRRLMELHIKRYLFVT